MVDLNGDVIIVTGASRGLGRLMTERFSEEGARVVLVSRTEDALHEIADGIPGETLVAPADVTKKREVDSVIDATIRAFGRIDTLVNNAGIGLLSLNDEPKCLIDVTEADWKRILAVNLTGPFLFTQAVLPQMVEQQGGNVINISSGLGRDVYLVGSSAWAPYTVSKWGLEALTKVTALEYDKDGVNANTLDPGGQVDTGFWDHLSEPERQEIMSPDVMNDAAVLLAAQGPDGVSGEGMDAPAWETRLGT
jgi:3-oxoacyl-[acyl-carrier protein] reductase